MGQRATRIGGNMGGSGVATATGSFTGSGEATATRAPFAAARSVLAATRRGTRRSSRSAFSAARFAAASAFCRA
eukprot:5556764-Prymnesium_polylepis.1